MQQLVIEFLGAGMVWLLLTLSVVLATFYAERKLSAFIQDRKGPMRAGPQGVLQPVADFLKLLQKEDLHPSGSIGSVFSWAPIFIFAVVFASLSQVPLANNWGSGGQETAVFFFLTVIALDVLGLIMAGWSSNNKFSMMGAMRASAQMIGYEIPMGLSVLAVAVWYGSLDFSVWADGQSSQNQLAPFFGTTGMLGSGLGGVVSWTLLQHPAFLLLAAICFIATLAESNRAPFDLPEGESELVSGFHTEYTGFRFAIFFLAEYTMMFVLSVLMVFAFFGAWHSPLPNLGPVALNQWTGPNASQGTFAVVATGAFWIFVKALILCLLMVVVRWTYPRLRIDQLMNLCWKYLIPFSLVGLLWVVLSL